MATKLYIDWLTEVAKYVQFASTYNDTVSAEVKEVIRDFCRDTGAWKITLDRITVIADTATYTLTVPTTNGKSEICYTDNVLYKENGNDDDQFRHLSPFTQEEADNWQYGSWSFHTAPNPYKFYSNADKQLILYPIPEDGSTEGLLVRVVVRPTDVSTKVPDFLYNEYKKAIAVGTAASLVNMPNKPWSDAILAKDLESQYLARRDEAHQMVKMGYTKKRQQVSIPYGGGSRSQYFSGYRGFGNG